MELPKPVPNWKDILKKAWVNRVLYLMFAVQIFDIVIKVIQSQPITVVGVIITILAPIGVFLRILSQVALATSFIPLPTATSIVGDKSESNT